MDKKTVFIKTTKGEHESANLPSDLKRILSLIDNRSTVDELTKRAPPSMRDGLVNDFIELVAEGYIRDKNKPEPKIVAPRSAPPNIAAPKMASPKIATPKSPPPKMFTSESESGDLDFNTKTPAAEHAAAEQAARKKAEAAARAHAELEAAMAEAKAKASAEAEARAQAIAKQEAEAAARVRAEAEAAARVRAEAEAKAKHEAMIREQAEAKAKLEAAIRLRTEQEAAQAKVAMEAAVRAKAEAAVRARREAEAQARQAAEAQVRKEAEEARLKAEQQAARIKAELEAAEKAKAEAEAARQKAEAEAARIKAELEAARARAEAEARALAEERARQEAEAARLKAIQEAEIARVKAEAEAKAKREAEEARIRAEQEAAARAKAEAERLKAEAEAARIRAELEAAKALAEAEAKLLAEARAKQVAEEQARQETERRIAEQEAAISRAKDQELEAMKARLKAEQEAEIARVRVEEEAKAKREAEKVRDKIEQEAAARSRALQEKEQAAKREAEEQAVQAALLAEQEADAHALKNTAVPAEESVFVINLDAFHKDGAEQESKDAVPVLDHAALAQAEAEVNARREAEQRAAAEAKVAAEMRSKQEAVAEMARLKEEAEAARRNAEEETRRQAEEQVMAEEQAKVWAEAEQRAQLQARVEAEQQASLIHAKAVQQQVTREHRKPLPWAKIVFGLVVMALLSVIVLPYVWPLQEYIAPLEQRLSAQLKQPVHIGGLKAASLPPTLQLQNVTVGAEKEVKVGSVVLNFDLIALLSQVKSIGNAELSDISIEGRQIEKQLKSLKALGGDANFPIRHISLQRMKIVTDEITLPVLSGIADTDAQGTFARVSIHSEDNKIGIDLQPEQGHWQLGVSLKESSLPMLSGYPFSDFSAKGEVGDGEVNFTELYGHIYGGILLGSAKLNWRKGWQLQGRLEAKTFELNKMFHQYGIDGDMFGEGTFSFAGAKLSQLGDAPHLEASFTVNRGTINGFDMVETARLLSRENMVGGRTHFEELTGTVLIENHTRRFRQIKIGSGMLQAGGSFDVSQGNQLSGSFNAEIKMRAGNNLLTLYGTLSEPKLRAGR